MAVASSIACIERGGNSSSNCTGWAGAHGNYSVADNPVAKTKAIVAFESCIVAIGIIGTVANGFVILILICARIKHGRLKTTNTFLINQLVIDWFSCVFLVVTYVWKLVKRNFTGTQNTLMCFFIESEGTLWVGMNSSVTNLTFITLERYVKIVHPIFHRKYHRKWMTYVGISITWFVGMLFTLPSNWVAINFGNGSCQAYSDWASQQDGIGYGIFNFLTTFFIPLLIFIYCYRKIWMVVQKSGKISHSDSVEYQQRKPVPAPPPSQDSSNETSRDIPEVTRDGNNRSAYTLLKTMISITTVFGVCWSPNNLYFLILNTECCQGLSVTSDAWYGTLFVAFLTNSVHPFIYGSKIDAVREYVSKFSLFTSSS